MSINDFERIRPKYERFTEKLDELLRSLLKTSGLQGGVESRTKTTSSFEEKLIRKGGSYVDPLKEITDFSGLRVIAGTLGDVDRICRMIKAEFEVDKLNSVEKGKNLDPNTFGYLSTHIVIEISHPRRGLAEWKDYEGLKAEVQVRTHSQHAWASVEHHLKYKRPDDAPKELQRRLFRLSALFELADQEISDIWMRSKELEAGYSEKMSGAAAAGIKSNIEINANSLSVYLRESNTIKSYGKIFSNQKSELVYIPNTFIVASGSSARIIGLHRSLEIIRLAGLRYIDELDEVLSKSLSWAGGYIVEILGTAYSQSAWPKKFSADTIPRLVVIANYIDIFTNETLVSLGYSENNLLIETAKKWNDYKEKTNHKAAEMSIRSTKI